MSSIKENDMAKRESPIVRKMFTECEIALAPIIEKY
jgi:hypothetical protein